MLCTQRLFNYGFLTTLPHGARPPAAASPPPIEKTSHSAPKTIFRGSHQKSKKNLFLSKDAQSKSRAYRDEIEGFFVLVKLVKKKKRKFFFAPQIIFMWPSWS